MQRVIIESPYAGKGVWPLSAWRRWRNVKYARACMRDSLLHRESPYASHLLYTQPGVLNDNKPREREFGIEAGLAWADGAALVAVYVDRGVTPGMKQGIAAHIAAGRRIHYRSLGRAWW